MKDAKKVTEDRAQWTDDTLGQGPLEKNASFRTPPPTVKSRTVRGVQNSISVVDENAGASAVQMRAFFILDFGPPPPLKVERSGASEKACGP
jgi:hypothetical protein